MRGIGAGSRLFGNSYGYLDKSRGIFGRLGGGHLNKARRKWAMGWAAVGPPRWGSPKRESFRIKRGKLHLPLMRGPRLPLR